MQRIGWTRICYSCLFLCQALGWLLRWRELRVSRGGKSCLDGKVSAHYGSWDWSHVRPQALYLLRMRYECFKRTRWWCRSLSKNTMSRMFTKAEDKHKVWHQITLRKSCRSRWDTRFGYTSYAIWGAKWGWQ